MLGVPCQRVTSAEEKLEIPWACSASTAAFGVALSVVRFEGDVTLDVRES